MSRRHPPTRREQYEADNARSARVKGDRIASKPPTLARLHRWLTDGYALEAPGRLHDRDIADDGAPDHTGEAKGYLGFAQGKLHDETHRSADGICSTCAEQAARVERPKANDWRAVACRTDDDGFYLTPVRAAISRIGDPDRRAFLGALACNAYTPLDVTRAFGVPDWCASDVMYRALDLVWAMYQDRPLPRRGKSDAQLDAEAA